MQVLVIPCMSCNKVFYKMPALCVVNQKVKYGLHVLHEIWNFFLFSRNFKKRYIIIHAKLYSNNKGNQRITLV